MSNERTVSIWAQANAPSGHPRRASPLCRVLVVDDDPLVRERLCMLLNASHYEVEVAATGAEALRILDVASCHIVLTDWEMPDMDGLALCRHVRLRTQDSYTYVLMLTIRDSEHDMLTGLAAGADDYVLKSTPIEELAARLDTGRRISHGGYVHRYQPRDDCGLSHQDSVTGAHSLSYLLQYLPRELSRSQRYGHALAVLCCHIDGLDQYTNRFGREAADDRLRSFVVDSETSVRKCDWVARIIGDSFMVVLPETTAAGAHHAAQKLRALFATHPRSTPPDSGCLTVTVEVTAVDGRHDAESTLQIEALLRTASRRIDREQRPDDAHSDSGFLPSAGPKSNDTNALN